MSSLLLVAPPVPGDSHPLLCRTWGAAAEDAAPEVQRAGSLRGSLPCLHPWSMCTRSCGLQSQRQLRVPLAITFPLGHRLHKLARLLRLLQPHGPAVLGMPLVPPSALSSLLEGSWLPGQTSPKLLRRSQHGAARGTTTAVPFHLALQGHFKPEIRGDPQHKRWLIKERKPPGRRWPESPAVQEKQAACKGQECYPQLAAEARAGRLCHTECHQCVTFLITINHNNHRAEEGNAVTLTGMTLGGGRGEAKPAAESHSWSRVLGGLMAGGVMGASTWDKSTARLPGTETWYQQDLHCITGLGMVHQ